MNIFKFRGSKSARLGWILVSALIGCALLSGSASAQVERIDINFKEGDPIELTADGSSQTHLMMDLSKCSWYPTAAEGDLLQIEFTTSLGTALSPPSINTTFGEVDFPIELTIRAGTLPGAAQITATASFCTSGNVMVFGVCSSIEEYDNPKCTGEFYIPIGGAAPAIEGEEKEESEDLSVAITCPSNPKKGESISCTASVSGAKGDESLEYIWSLDGSAGSKTKNNSFNWQGEESGYYEVSVEVFGDNRTVKNTLLVNVFDPETKPEEDQPAESTETSSLISSLEAFLKSAGVGKIDPARLAVAGTGVSALIAIWMIIQHRSGVPMEKLEQALGKWRWREGAEAPQPSPEGDQKPPEKLPETLPKKTPATLPEGLKSEKPPQTPVTLPEEMAAELEAKASAAAEEQDQSKAEPSPTLPPPPKESSGETVEEQAERIVDDTEDYRAAVDKTLEDFKKKLEEVPTEVKDSEFWKQKVAPLLKKLDELGIEEKSGKLKEFLRITKELLEVRKKVDADLSFLSKKDREGVVWLERGLQGGEEALKKLHNQLITDPAISAAKAVLPKDQAAAAEKILKQHQADIEKMLEGIKKLPRKFAEYAGKASQRHQLDQEMNQVTNQVWQHEGFKDKYKFDITKSPKKLTPVIKAVSDAASAAKKALGRVFISLRDTGPDQ
jgi:nitrogen regulatory protein PII